MASQDRKWFANRGQMLQVGINALALAITGKNAWSEMMASRFLAVGALLFYALVGLVVLSFVWMVRSQTSTVSRTATASTAVAVANTRGIYIGNVRQPDTPWVTYTPQHGALTTESDSIRFQGVFDNGWRYPEHDDEFFARTAFLGLRFKPQGEVVFYAHFRGSSAIVISTRCSGWGIDSVHNEFRVPLPAEVSGNQQWQVVLLRIPAIQLIQAACKSPASTILVGSVGGIYRFSVRGSLRLSHIWCLEDLAQLPSEFLPGSIMLP